MSAEGNTNARRIAVAALALAAFLLFAPSPPINPQKGGFNRHVFYSTGYLNRDLGLDPMTNHFAFQADGSEDLDRRRQRLLDLGKDVLEIDHGWIHSIYTEDPDGNVVEFAMLTKRLTEDDAKEALELLQATSPPPAAQKPRIEFHRSDTAA